MNFSLSFAASVLSVDEWFSAADCSINSFFLSMFFCGVIPFAVGYIPRYGADRAFMICLQSKIDVILRSYTSAVDSQVEMHFIGAHFMCVSNAHLVHLYTQIRRSSHLFAFIMTSSAFDVNSNSFVSILVDRKNRFTEAVQQTLINHS